MNDDLGFDELNALVDSMFEKSTSELAYIAHIYRNRGLGQQAEDVEQYLDRIRDEHYGRLDGGDSKQNAA